MRRHPRFRHAATVVLTAAWLLALPSQPRSEAAPAPAPGGPVADAEHDFQPGWVAGVNPYGAWTYGWSATLASPLHLFTTQLNGAPVNNNLELMWVDPGNMYGFAPSVARNSGGAFNDGNVIFDPGALILTHGDGGTYAHVVWTAPTDGTYYVTTTFKAQQYRTSTDVHVLFDGAHAFDDVLTSEGQSRSFSGRLALGAGRTIDFAVGPNGDPRLHPGNTRLEATIVAANRPPVATAGGPYTVAEGGSATLDGRDSSDPDGDPLSFAWDLDGDGTFDATGPAPVFSAAGRDGPAAATVALRVCDPQGACDTAAGEVTIDNVAPVPDAGRDQTVFRNQEVVVRGAWTDPGGPVDAPYTWSWDWPGGGASGTATYGTEVTRTATFATAATYTLTFATTDKDGGRGVDSMVVTVLNRPPDCRGATPSLAQIWPPDHRLVAVGVGGVSDPEGDPVGVVIGGIRQDEAVDAGGDGHTGPDGTGVGTPTAAIRAERSGAGDGRVYHIAFTATDGHGGTCAGEVRVSVPHDRSRPALDQGPRFDSTTAS